jgi:hypothetical protein
VSFPRIADRQWRPGTDLMRMSDRYLPTRLTGSTSPPVHYEYNAFISYTTREEEVRQIKPFIDAFVDRLKRSGVTVCPVFYDGWHMERRRYERAELVHRLGDGISGSAFTIAFVSPGYVASEWCQFEWRTTVDVHSKRDTPALDYSILPILWKTLPRMLLGGRARRRMLAEIQERLAWKGYGFVPSKGEAVDISSFDLGDPWSGAPYAMWHCAHVAAEYLSRWYPEQKWDSVAEDHL